MSQFIEDKLRSDPNCTRFIHDFLVLIQQEMLVVEGGQRITADCVAERLHEMQVRAGLSLDGYFTKPVPWPVLT